MDYTQLIPTYLLSGTDFLLFFNTGINCCTTHHGKTIATYFNFRNNALQCGDCCIVLAMGDRRRFGIYWLACHFYYILLFCALKRFYFNFSL